MRILSSRNIVVAALTAWLSVVFPGTSAAAYTPASPDCEPGEFCYWASEDYPGEKLVLDLSPAQASTCVPLPNKAQARSFANLRENEITVYEGGHCSTEGDFRTYPAGSVVPQAPFVVRAVEIWQ